MIGIDEVMNAAPVIPVLVLDCSLDPAELAATLVGAASVMLSLIEFLRWVFVVPPLAASYVEGDPVTRRWPLPSGRRDQRQGAGLMGGRPARDVAKRPSRSTRAASRRSECWIPEQGSLTLHLSGKGRGSSPGATISQNAQG